ncbi:MAG TPA: hypothetical protein VE338_21060 [Ktedonobacterales bacterium]|jgi:hypothetical protein|nr:hypothetical protein [Ktedonobacterales bacterium]
MLHYKAFTSDTTNGDIAALERMVNAWLDEVHPLVHTMTQSPHGAGLVISFLYDLEEEQRERVATAEAEVGESLSVAEPELALGDSLMISLLPQMELPY